MDVATRVFLPRVIDILVDIALHRPITARRVRVEPPARLDSEVGRLLHRLDRAIFGRLDDARSLAPAPRTNGWPGFVIMASTGLAFLAAPTRTAPQCLLPALLGLPFVARGVREGIGCDRAVQLPLPLIGQGRIAQPPAPAVAGPDMDTHCSGDAPG